MNTFRHEENSVAFKAFSSIAHNKSEIFCVIKKCLEIQIFSLIEEIPLVKIEENIKHFVLNKPY